MLVLQQLNFEKKKKKIIPLSFDLGLLAWESRVIINHHTMELLRKKKNEDAVKFI